MDKITSLRINEELWRKAKMLAAMRGTTLKAIIEELLRREIEAEEILKDEAKVSEEDINILMRRRMEGKLPFTIISDKSAVDLVKEGRGY
jgi:predicted transcriptional regulator